MSKLTIVPPRYFGSASTAIRPSTYAASMMDAPPGGAAVRRGARFTPELRTPATTAYMATAITPEWLHPPLRCERKDRTVEVGERYTLLVPGLDVDDLVERPVEHDIETGEHSHVSRILHRLKKSGVSFPSDGSQTIDQCRLIISPRGGKGVCNALAERSQSERVVEIGEPQGADLHSGQPGVQDVFEAADDPERAVPGRSGLDGVADAVFRACRAFESSLESTDRLSTGFLQALIAFSRVG